MAIFTARQPRAAAHRAVSQTRRIAALCSVSLVAVAAVVVAVGQPSSAATTWNGGDVFVAAGNGTYRVYDNSGAFKETLTGPLSGTTTGCAFNASGDKLYTTNWTNNKVVVYDNADPHPVLQTISTNTNSGLNESVVFAGDGTFYVSHATPQGSIDHFDATGTLIATIAPHVRTDWMDLANDQKTMFYSDEITHAVRRWDVSTNSPVSNFATGLPGVNTFALRILPPGDGTGGVLVATSNAIERLDGSGHVVQTYGAPGETKWFALNLDPNGTSFWSGDATSDNFYRFNIATGAIEVGPINIGTSVPNTLTGLCVKGELTAITTTPPTPAPSPTCAPFLGLIALPCPTPSTAPSPTMPPLTLAPAPSVSGFGAALPVTGRDTRPWLWLGAILLGVGVVLEVALSRAAKGRK